MTLFSRLRQLFQGRSNSPQEPLAETGAEPETEEVSGKTVLTDTIGWIPAHGWHSIWERSWPDPAAERGYCVEHVGYRIDDGVIHVALLARPRDHPLLRDLPIPPDQANWEGLAVIPGVFARFEQAPETVSLIRMISECGQNLSVWRQETPAPAESWKPVGATMAFACERKDDPALLVLAEKRVADGTLLRLARHAPGDIPPDAYDDGSEAWVDAGTAWISAEIGKENGGWVSFLAERMPGEKMDCLLAYRYDRMVPEPEWPWVLEESCEEHEFARTEQLDLELTRGFEGDELCVHVLRRSGALGEVHRKFFWRVRDDGSPGNYQPHSSHKLALLKAGDDMVELLEALFETSSSPVIGCGVPRNEWLPLTEPATGATRVAAYRTQGALTAFAMADRTAGGYWVPQDGAAQCLVVASATTQVLNAPWVRLLLQRRDILAPNPE